MDVVKTVKSAIGAVTGIGAWVAQTWFQITHRAAVTPPVPPRFKIMHYVDHGFAAFEWCPMVDAYRVIIADGGLGVYESYVVSSLLLDENFVKTETEAHLRINTYARSGGTAPMDLPRG